MWFSYATLAQLLTIRPCVEQSYRSRGRPSKFLSARTHARAVRMRSLGATVHRAVGASHLAKLRLVIFSKNLEFTTVFFRYQWSGTAHWKSGGTARRGVARACAGSPRACVCARRRLKAGPRATRRQLLPGRLTISCAVMRRCQISATLPTSRPAATALRGRRRTHFQLSNLNFTGANSPSEGRLVVKKQTNLG